MRIRLPAFTLLALGAISLSATSLAAQSLRGSRASVDLMYDRAQEEDLAFYRTSSSVREAVREGELVRIEETSHLALGRVSYPYVLEGTRSWVTEFADRYYARCGQRLVVTSGARPMSRTPRNGSPKSVHPTGMAVDLRRPTGSCLVWLRKELLVDESNGSVEATEERHPAHFHVAVLSVEPAAQTRTAVDASSDGGVEHEETAETTQLAHYRVRPGDTLWEIARRRDTTVARIRELNKLRSARIKPGQLLLLPTSS
jgi:LysM repeat protein